MQTHFQVLIFSISLPFLVLCDISSHDGYRHDLSPPQIIRSEGYPCEVYKVTTDDGYILEMHRIPHGINNQNISETRPVVFVQHGLLSSSADWVIAAPKKALGYILADAGYDVWMGNFRGNSYSRNHLTLKPSKIRFWKFSWDQMAKYDLPAMLKKTMSLTNSSQIQFVGHSMGTTVFMAMLNIYPDMKEHFHLAHFLSPIAYISHTISPIKYFAKFGNEIGWVLNHLGAGEFLPSRWLMNVLSALFCKPGMNHICKSTIFLLCGYDHAQTNSSLLPTIIQHTPAGTSTYTVVQYAQEFNTGDFKAMDWGKKQNIKYHGSEVPPRYQIEAVDVPVAVYRGKNDWLAQEEDVIHVVNRLPQLYDDYIVPYDDWNHVDFLWAIDADRFLYKKLIDNMKRYENKDILKK